MAYRVSCGAMGAGGGGWQLLRRRLLSQSVAVGVATLPPTPPLASAGSGDEGLVYFILAAPSTYARREAAQGPAA